MIKSALLPARFLLLLCAACAPASAQTTLPSPPPSIAPATSAPAAASAPTIQTIEIHGAGRTRARVILHAAGLKPGQVLTNEAFARALRRLHELPAAADVRLNYRSITSGTGAVDVVITEHHVFPDRWPALGEIAGRALILDELNVDVAGALTAGENGNVLWQWKSGRPSVGVGVAVPSPAFVPGIIVLDGFWERQPYNITPEAADATVIREERRHAGLHVSDWASSRLRWQAGAAYDRMREYDGIDISAAAVRGYLSVDGTIDFRAAEDRLAIVTSGGWWRPASGSDRGMTFGTAGLLVAARSTADVTRAAWSGDAEISSATRLSPLALWGGAGTGGERDGLLRAHRLVHDEGVLSSPVFGRNVAHGTLEYARPVARPHDATIAVAAFVDVAKAWRRLAGLAPESRLYVDAGIGVRLHAPGPGAAIRIDLATGLRGGGTRMSAGWGGSWPR